MTLLADYERQAVLLDRRERELPLSIRESLAHAGLLRFLGLPQPEMADAHANFAYSLVATAPSPASSGTSLVVTAADGAKFPGVPFNATIWPAGAQPTTANAEIVRATARSADTLTITRAQESSSARTVVIGDQIAATVTAKTLTDVEAGLGYGASVFGDGSDGSVTFDGSTTILGMAPSSSVYSLTRDFFFSAVTLNSGVQIKTNGFRLFCSGTFTGVDATSIIQWNGLAASVGVAGTGTNNTNSSFNTSTGGGSPGTAGATGGTAAGAAGTAATSVLSWGGQGGAGGTAGANGGGAGGALIAVTALQGSLRAVPWAHILHHTVSAGFGANPIAGGTGGGAGGGDGSSVSGAGGGGGGIVPVYVKTFAGTGSIQARGGAGGTPATGNRAGGGGGGGGLVIVVSQSVVAGAVAGWTIDANGGARGVKIGTATENATAGSNGTVILLPA